MNKHYEQFLLDGLLLKNCFYR